ncbi:MAG: TonB-dependent receptor [Cytophagales bacterium]|nr:TonB-dependent receptor [Cytophagales bacterium]
MKLNHKLFLVSLWLCLCSASVAQSQVIRKIQLLDKQSLQPIVGASYQYGGQNGHSDSLGVIVFRWNPDASMHLSHLIYGKWFLESNHLSKASSQPMTVFREEQNRVLQPVSVISVRIPINKSEDIPLRAADRTAHDAGELLRRTAAVSGVRKSGAYGLDPVLRGFKYSQLNIVLDGCATASAACPNRMDPPTSQMAPNMLRRIEILKGPYALRYGCGIGGTMHFVSKTPEFSDSRKIYGRLSNSYESNGNITKNEGMLGLRGQRHEAMFFLSGSGGHNYRAGNGEKIPAEFRRISWGSALGFRLSPNQTIKLTVTNNRADDTDFAALPMDLRKDNTWIVQAQHQLNLKGKRLKQWNSALFGSLVNHEMDNLQKVLQPRKVDASTLAKTRNFGGRTEGTWHFDAGRLYFGGDFRRETAEGERTRNMLMGKMKGKVLNDDAWQDGRISKASLFAEYQLRKYAFQWIFSGRFEWNEASAQNPSENLILTGAKNSQLNPSFSLGIVKPVNEQFSTSLWLGRAQRSGSLTERYINSFPVGNDPYELIGNPELDPEVNNQVDLVFEWKKKSNQLKVDLFCSWLQNGISSVIDPTVSPVLPTSPGVRRFINLGESLKTGFELSWSQTLGKHLQHHVDIAYTFGEDLERKEALPEIAPMDLRYTLSGVFLNGKILSETTFRKVLKQNRIAEEYGETPTDGFHTLGINFSYQMFSWLKLSASADNLFDASYYEHLSRSVREKDAHPIYAPGINFRFGVLASFGQ